MNWTIRHIVYFLQGLKRTVMGFYVGFMLVFKFDFIV